MTHLRITPLSVLILVFLLINVHLSEEISDINDADEGADWRQHYVVRRDIKGIASTSSTSPPMPAPTVKVVPYNMATNASVPAKPNATAVEEHTVSTQRIPNVGVNGSGILKNNVVPKSTTDPNRPDEYYNTAPKVGVTKSDIDVAGIIDPDNQMDNLSKTDHDYYLSTFIGDPQFFKEHWANVTKMQYETHQILSSSHRRATMINLKFGFPFYGQTLKNLTVATGGFIYTGEHVHNWLAATQYIAPLMANFDTRVSNDSVVKIADDGTNFTVIWENVTLQNYQNESFTFAVTLRQDGDIIFAYKDIPIPVQYIEDKEHPVKVGISDAYLADRVVFYKRRKTVYEYHRINFLDHNITSGTVLRLHAQPTCLLFNTCSDCVNHNTTFACNWCPSIERCSNGNDRQKQDWLLRNCHNTQISKIDQCAALNSSTTKSGDATTNNPTHDIILKHDYDIPTLKKDSGNKDALVANAASSHSSLGGVVVLFIAIILLGFGSAWVFYAYKNPHTRSGQFLIKQLLSKIGKSPHGSFNTASETLPSGDNSKRIGVAYIRQCAQSGQYRPSTWSWKRGEARYTAATIHM